MKIPTPNFTLKSPKTIAIALASASLLVGGVAVAQQTHGDKGPMTRAEVAERSLEKFAKMDANGDGQLDSTDRDAKMAERFAAADTDGDGVLTRAEVTAAREARRGERQDRRAARGADTENGERMKRGGKRGGKHGMRGGRGMRGMEMMAQADTDGNGSVSQAEFQAAALARFDKADTNGDGTVTAEERKAARQAHRAERSAERTAS